MRTTVHDASRYNHQRRATLPDRVMARNQRGGWQRERNNPPGWGNSGQPAQDFAFGGNANPAQQHQPQVQNRFQALQPARGGRGGAACYTCGQVGHLQRDCPQAASARRGNAGGGGDGGAARPGGPARVTDADAKRIVGEDMRESPLWPFSCYAPDFAFGQGGVAAAGYNLLAGDVSFEEARVAAYSALATGGPAAAQASGQRLAEAAERRQNDRRQLASMAQAALAQQLQAAAAGRPAQAAMPELDWSFPAAGARPVVHGGQSILLQPNAGPLQPPPVAFPPPQLQQQLPQQPQLQPVPVRTSMLLQPQMGFTPLQNGGAGAPPAAPPPAASDAECWMAAAFRPGGIPETAPPAQFA